MKFFAAALIPLFACVPSSFGAFTFSIAGGDPPATWEVQNAATNQVTITFDVSQALGTGDGSTAFHVATENCGNNQYDYSISPAPGANVQDNADPLVVTFINDQHITATTYCILVKLMIDDMATPAATKEFTYGVTAAANGQAASVDFSMNVIFGISGNVDPGFFARCTTPDIAVAVGQTFTAQVISAPGYETEIVDVTLPCGFPVLTDNTGQVSYPAESEVNVTLPLGCHANISSVEVTLTVDWWINETAVRRLRALQDSEESPDGYHNYTFEMQVIPLHTHVEADVTAAGLSGYFDPGLSLALETPGTAIAFGQPFSAQVTSASGFDTQIVGVAVPCGTPILASNNGQVSYPTKAEIDVFLPITCFADTARSLVSVTVTVDWWVNNGVARRGRGLQASDELPDSGFFDYTVEVMIVPLDDRRSTSDTKFYYTASAAIAAVAAASILFMTISSGAISLKKKKKSSY
jgi:hypothetical protein